MAAFGIDPILTLERLDREIQSNTWHADMIMSRQYRDLDAVLNAKLVIGAEPPPFLSLGGKIEQFVEVEAPFFKVDLAGCEVSECRFGNNLIMPRLASPPVKDRFEWSQPTI